MFQEKTSEFYREPIVPTSGQLLAANELSARLCHIIELVGGDLRP
jgi:hypothetical protein